MNIKYIKFVLINFIMLFVFSTRVYSLSCTYNYDKEDYKLEENNVIYKVDELVIDIVDFELAFTKKIFSSKSVSSNDFTVTNFADGTSSFHSKLTINDFESGEDNNKIWKCPDLYFLAEVDFSMGLHTYTISTDSSKGVKLNFVSSSDEDDSVEETLNDSTWIKVCRYGKETLKISETTFNFSNVDSEYLHFDLNDIKSYSYQCPPYICSSYADGMGTYYSISDTDVSGYNTTCYEAISITDGCIVYNNLSESYIENKDSQSLKKLKDYCSVQLKNNDFDYDCVKSCLKLDDILENIELSNSKCGFSEKLIIYIANIIKWVKYLIPVVVIVLGILDFIKAIAAGKDDEMKKAQGSFVKRLIAAALIFIVPFIIEFVLDKMGFGTNGCGIIDL